VTSSSLEELGRLRPRPGPDITGVAFDSRRIKPGYAFFALPGRSTHGIQFADEALAKGAALIVSNLPHPAGVVVADPEDYLLDLGRRSRRARTGPVIGITGSVGKTTTKDLLAAALAAYSSPGNRNTPLAHATELVSMEVVAKPTKPIVLELGIDHVGEMDKLIDLVIPTHGLITAITTTHLDGLKDLATIATEKARLLEFSNNAFADVKAAQHLPTALRKRTVTYGLTGEGADFEPSFSIDPAGEPILKVGSTYRLPGIGRTAARNAAGALAVAEALNIPAAKAAERMENAKLSPRRLKIIPLETVTVIDDSYNSSPASLEAALEVLLASHKPTTAVLGDMLELGSSADDLHRSFSSVAMAIDRLVTVGEKAALIAPNHPDAIRVSDAEEAVEELTRLQLEGTVLVKGSRGIHLEQVIFALAPSAEQL
jgi:UDP-N-acetylmuramoyl-tripeptide--D-alanyl-D-alanine ligase